MQKEKWKILNVLLKLDSKNESVKESRTRLQRTILEYGSPSMLNDILLLRQNFGSSSRFFFSEFDLGIPSQFFSGDSFRKLP